MKKNSAHQDEAARRAYWTEQMEAAHRFMEEAMAWPVTECGEPMVSLPEAVRDAGVEVVFSGTKLAGAYPRLFCVRAGLVEKFLAVAREMNARGWTLKVEDGFRSPAMQKRLTLQDAVFDAVLNRVAWELGGRIPSADLLFRRLSVLCATVPKVGTHMSGSALDVSVLDRETGAEIQRGGGYLEMSERTPMNSPFISESARENRRAISEIFQRHGFVAYPYEFWHYSQGDAYEAILLKRKRPARYGPVEMDPASGKVEPVPAPERPLHAVEEFREQVAAALGRARLS